MDPSPYHQLADTKNYFKTEGKKYTYKPKALNIIWGKDKRYWKITDDVAELLQVSWLEVTGVAEGLKPKTKYKISFEISLEPYAFGWEGIKIYVLAKVGKQGTYSGQPFSPPNDKDKISLIVDTKDAKDLTLYFGLYEFFSGVWKGGLKIYQATVEEVLEK